MTNWIGPNPTSGSADRSMQAEGGRLAVSHDFNKAMHGPSTGRVVRGRSDSAEVSRMATLNDAVFRPRGLAA
jgi:hypothetical protein